MSEAEREAVETWRPVEGWPYEVSDRGQVRNLQGRVLRGSMHPGGYRKVFMRNAARVERNTYVHHLVLGAFVGPAPHGYECNHRDGDKTNNAPENLEWVTHRENVDHSMRAGLRDYSTGRRPIGETNGAARLTEESVRSIRARYAAGGKTQKAIAAEHGVDRSLVGLIVRGKLWKHAPLPSPPSEPSKP